jgi:hypothetical protein
MLARLDAHKLVFPVVSISIEKSDYLGLWGTAFPIGANLFITAKHVIQAALRTLETSTAQYLALGQPERDIINGNHEWIFSTFGRYEMHEDLDIAIFELEESFDDVFVPAWASQGLNLLNDVVTFGYPHALDVTNKVINVRGIKGHIIGTGKRLYLDDPVFQAYELSFRAPRGLSGAPLLTDAPHIKVCGMIVCNGEYEMEVASHEVISEDGNKTIYTKVEVMHIGTAIQRSELIRASFDMVGGSIEEYLVQHQLLNAG